eukprot:7524419-Karenia_brevis.AAC.1
MDTPHSGHTTFTPDKQLRRSQLGRTQTNKRTDLTMDTPHSELNHHTTQGGHTSQWTHLQWTHHTAN